jgi:LuxR family transcriptional regulator, maltose regulon positive regulatory protein
LARQYESVIDRFIISAVFLAHLKMAQGDVGGAAAILAQAMQSALQRNFVHRIPEVAAAQVGTLLRQGNLAAAGHLARTHGLPMSQARVHLARGETAPALSVLETWRGQVEARDLEDERLKVMVLQAVALHSHGEKDKAAQVLGEALALAEPGGFVRVFVDEGAPMAQLLSEVSAHGIAPDYIGRLLAAFGADEQQRKRKPPHVRCSAPCRSRPSPHRAFKSARTRSAATHRSGTLEQRDQ